MSILGSNGRILSNGHAPLSSTVIDGLRKHEPAKLNAAALTYVNDNVSLHDAYAAKTGYRFSRSDRCAADSAAVSFEANAVSVTVQAGHSRINFGGGPQPALQGLVALTIRFEGEGLRNFAAGVEAALAAPAPSATPDIVVRRR